MLVTRIALSLAFLLVTAVIDYFWLAAAGDATAVIGVTLGTVTTVLFVLGVPLRWCLVPFGLLVATNIFMTLLFMGMFGAEPAESMGLVVLLQWIWTAMGIALLVVIRLHRDRVLTRRVMIALEARAREDREAKRAAIESQRMQEIAYAEEVERLRLAADRSTGPGDLTGFEPQHLEAIQLEPTANMHGEPGAGLSGSDFGEHRVKRGQEGEVNFARALQKEELLGRFATFWSVHLPDAEIGASEVFQGDVDCVVLTGSTLWLVDVKNYRQGGVVWRQKRTGDADILYAIDRQTGGYVGPRDRRMSENMRMAAARFTHRLQQSALQRTVRPVVVMMPQEDGLGTIEDIFYPGNVPLVGLPTLLDWLRPEPAHDADSEDGRLLTLMLKALLKDASGTAVIPEGFVGRDAAQKEWDDYQRARRPEGRSG